MKSAKVLGMLILTVLALSLLAIGVAGQSSNFEDSDDDGLPDWWELKNNLDVNNDDADEDPDGDGFSNMEEFKADSDPYDPSSFAGSDTKKTLGITWGVVYAILGAALAFTLPAVGSSVGVWVTGTAGAGLTAEEPEKFGKVMLLQALPMTQAIYGFLVFFLILINLNVIGGLEGFEGLSTPAGLWVLFASLPIAIAGLVSGIFQGYVCSAGVGILAKNPEDVSKAMILAIMVETFAVFGLLCSIFMILWFPSGA